MREGETMTDTAQEVRKQVKWYHTKWGVLVILGTIGPLGFYALWKSPEFNLFWKWMLTILTLLLTLFLVVTAEMLPLLVGQYIGRF